MKRLTLVAVVSFLAALMAPAHGAERYLGTITVSDAGFTSNIPKTDAGFPIAPGAKLSIQPDSYAYVCVDSHVNNGGNLACSAASGVIVPGGTLFPTSCSKQGTGFFITEILSDAGIYDGGRTVPSCSVACVSYDAGTTTCRVFERTGDEL